MELTPIEGSRVSLRGIDADADGGPSEQILQMWIPLAIQSLGSRELGILQCQIVNAEIHGSDAVRFRVAQPIQVHTYEGMREGDLISSRPISLKPDHGDRKALLLRWGLGLPDLDVPAKGKIDGREILIEIDVTFDNQQVVRFRAEVEPNLETGHLEVKSFGRTARPARILINLLIILLAVSFISYWNFRLNQDVHDAAPTAGQNVVSMVLGSLLTFLGLSLPKVNDWVRTLTNLNAFLKYPELHIEKALTELLRTRFASLVLIVVGVAILLITGINWSVGLPASLDQRLVLHDVQMPVGSGQYAQVTSSKVYLRHIEAGRFFFACRREVPGPNHPLAVLKRQRFKPVQVGLAFELSGLGDLVFALPTDTIVKQQVSGTQLLDAELEHGQGALRSAFCGETEQPGEGFFEVDYLDPRSLQSWISDPKFHEIQGTTEPAIAASVRFEPDRHISLGEVSATFARFREDHLRDQSLNAMWRDRTNHVEAVVELGQELDGRLTPQVFGEGWRILVGQAIGRTPETPDREKTLERSILIRGLTKMARDRMGASEPPTEEILQLLSTQFPMMEWGQVHYQVVRAFWETALELELLTGEGRAVHHLIAARDHAGQPQQSRVRLHNDGAEAVLHYLGATLAVSRPDGNLLDNPARWAFFQSPVTIASLKKKAERVNDLIELVLTTYLHHPPADTSDWRDQLLELFASVW